MELESRISKAYIGLSIFELLQFFLMATYEFLIQRRGLNIFNAIYLSMCLALSGYSLLFSFYVLDTTDFKVWSISAFVINYILIAYTLYLYIRTKGVCLKSLIRKNFAFYGTIGAISMFILGPLAVAFPIDFVLINLFYQICTSLGTLVVLGLDIFYIITFVGYIQTSAKTPEISDMAIICKYGTITICFSVMGFAIYIANSVLQQDLIFLFLPVTINIIILMIFYMKLKIDLLHDRQKNRIKEHLGHVTMKNERAVIIHTEEFINSVGNRVETVALSKSMKINI